MGPLDCACLPAFAGTASAKFPVCLAPLRVLGLELDTAAPLESKFGFLLEKGCFLIAREREEILPKALAFLLASTASAYNSLMI